MSKAKTPEEKAAAQAKKDEAKAAAGADKADLGSLGKEGFVDVVDADGQIIRTYTKEQEVRGGQTFIELAQEFASKAPGRRLQ